KAMYIPSPDPLIDKLWIDKGAAILDHPKLQQLHNAGISIDFQPGGLNAIGEGKGVFARDKVPGSHKLGLNPRRQRIGTKIHNARKLAQIDPWRTIDDIHDAIVDNVEFPGRRLQDGGRYVENVLAQHFGG